MGTGGTYGRQQRDFIEYRIASKSRGGQHRILLSDEDDALIELNEELDAELLYVSANPGVYSAVANESKNPASDGRYFSGLSAAFGETRLQTSVSAVPVWDSFQKKPPMMV